MTKPPGPAVPAGRSRRGPSGGTVLTASAFAGMMAGQPPCQRCTAIYTRNSGRTTGVGDTSDWALLEAPTWMRQTAAVADQDPGPVVQRILLGAELRDARDSKGLSTAEATKRLGWYSGKLSKIEQGDKNVTDKDLATAIKVFGIEAGRAETLKRLASEARRKLPPARVPEWATKYVNLIAAAAEIKIFFPDSFPGTVQTVDYARAVLTSAVTVAPSEVERMAEERAKRVNRLMGDDAALLWLIVGEEALYREIGGKIVLRAQLEQVKALAESPNATVQVVPFDGGAHSCHGAAFTIISLIEGRPGIVYSEGLTGSDYLGREHVRVYSLAYDNLRAAALSPKKTLDVLARRIEDLV